MSSHGRSRRFRSADADSAVPMVFAKVDGELVLVRQDETARSHPNRPSGTGATAAVVVFALGVAAAAAGAGTDPSDTAAGQLAEPVPAASAPAAVAVPAPAEAALVTVTADYELVAASKSTAKTVIGKALSQVGAPYVWGAKGKKTGSGKRTFDCSGFVWWVHQGTDKEYGYGNTTVMRRQGDPVAKSDLQPGDIVFFYGGGHMGIYTGDGMVVHASGTKEKGGKVKHVPMSKMRFHSARRL